jgi:hypothetical protein
MTKRTGSHSLASILAQAGNKTSREALRNFHTPHDTFSPFLMAEAAKN